MAREGTQQKLGHVRPPRVHITYDVETGGAMDAGSFAERIATELEKREGDEPRGEIRCASAIPA